MEILRGIKSSIQETFSQKKEKTVSSSPVTPEDQTTVYKEYQGGVIISMSLYENGEAFQITEVHQNHPASSLGAHLIDGPQEQKE